MKLRKHTFAALCVLACLVPGLLVSQEEKPVQVVEVSKTAPAQETGTTKPVQAMEAPKPGSEHERLGYFAGKWVCEADLKENTLAPAAKMSWTETYTWFAGRFALICEYEGSGPWGPVKGQSVLGYDREEKEYTYFGIDSMGNIGKSKGVLEGETWTWTGERKAQGTLIKFHYCVKETASNSRTFWEEISKDGVTFTRILEGKGTRIE